MASDGTHTIYIKMLGGFSVTVDGRKIDFGGNQKANFLKLIEMVCLYGDAGITKRQLIEGVFGGKELLDENNSLNNLLHQARSQMKKSGIPGKKYIIGKRGMYMPEKAEGYETELDVDLFRANCEKAIREEDPAERTGLYEDAMALFAGELLPEFSTDYWVIIENVRLKSYYDDAVNWLGEVYRKREEYDRLQKLYEEADRIYPESGWQIRVIDAMILRKDYRGAYGLSNQAAKYYQEELEVPIPEELRSCFERLYDNLKIVSDDIEEIQASIIRRDEVVRTGGSDGGRLCAYFCQFASFIDVYHVLRRNLLRRGQSILMMLCTLVDYEGKPIQNQDKLGNRAEAMQEALAEVLRQGDVFTKYSASQFLVLLIGTRKEDCPIIYHRVARKLKEYAGARADFQYRIVSLGEIPSVLKQST